METNVRVQKWGLCLRKGAPPVPLGRQVPTERAEAVTVVKPGTVP